MNPILECSGLSKQYTSGCYALNNLNLSLERGQIIGLLGPNGSGKTTFIKLINDLLTPTSGQILIDGKLPGVDTKAMISYLPERTHLDQTMKIKDLIKYFADFYEDFRAERAFTMLKDLNIDQNARLKNLSKGTKEKVQLILVMSRDAKLYILDEPIGGVDPAARDYILHTILNNYNEEATILLSTHLIHDIESILDQVIFIRQHLFSKTIVGTAWCLLDQLLLLGSIFLIFHAEPLRDLFNANKAELLEAFGFTGAYADLTLLKIALYVLLFLLISALSSVIMIYASIVIGQLFTNHRVLGSVICYIGLTTLLSIISYALLFALGLVSLKVTDTSMSMQYFSTVSYMVKTLNLSMILALVTSVILYTITYQLMRVKLNLN